MTRSVRAKRLNRKTARLVNHSPANRTPFKVIHSRNTPKSKRGKLRVVSDTGVPERAVLEGMKVAELKELCLGRGIAIHSKLKKKQLIEMLIGR